MDCGHIAVWRRIGLALIALGLALRLAIAPGMMPVATPAGMTLTLCTAQGPVTYTLDIHGQKAPDKAHDPCPYGAMAAVPLLPLPILPLASLIREAVPLPLFGPAVSRPHIGAPAPPPPATGPPALA